MNDQSFGCWLHLKLCVKEAKDDQQSPNLAIDNPTDVHKKSSPDNVEAALSSV